MQWSNTEHIACCLTSDFELIDFVDCNSAGELTETLMCSSAQIDRCLDNTDFTDVPDDLPRFNPFCRLVKHAVDVLRLFDRHCSGKSKKRKCITHFNTFAAYRRNECRLLQNVYHHFSFLLLSKCQYAYISCGFRSEWNSRSPCWPTKFSVASRPGIWDHSTVLPIYLVDAHSAPLAPTNNNNQ